MRILSPNAGLLTNIEVLDSIQEKRARNSNSSGDHQAGASLTIDLQNREYVEKKSVEYIKGTTVGKQQPSHVRECIKSLIKLDFGLTEAEIIQIANTCPQSDVEFYLIVEDCSERLDDEKMILIKELTAYMIGNYSE